MRSPVPYVYGAIKTATVPPPPTCGSGDICNAGLHRVQLGPAAGNVAVLLGAEVSNAIDANGYTGCRIGVGGGSWFVEATGATFSQMVGAASCKAAIVALPAGGVSFSAFLPAPDPGLEASQWDAQKKELSQYQDLGSVQGKQWFLSRVHATALRSPENALGDPALCEIFERDQHFWLRAKNTNTAGASGSKVRCQAIGFALPSNAFPPINPIVSSSPTTAFPTGRPATPFGSGGPSGPLGGTPSSTSEADQGRYFLYKSTDGVYDRPFVFVEGVDPMDRTAPPRIMQSLGAMAWTLRQAPFNYDIVIVDAPDGAGDPFLLARHVAEGIQWAYASTEPTGGQAWADVPANAGKKFPLAGVSQGGISTRVALSTWEQDLYRDGTLPGAEPIPSIVARPTPDRKPPISTWVSQAGSHYGVYVPQTLQAFMEDLAAMGDMGQGLAKSEPWQALRSPAAQALLRQHVPLAPLNVGTQGIVSNVGDLLTTPLPTPGEWSFFGATAWVTTPAPLAADNSAAFKIAMSGGGSWTAPNCSVLPRPINCRGALLNGWPQSTTNVGMINASWYRQGYLHLPDDTLAAWQFPSWPQYRMATPVWPGSFADEAAKRAFAATAFPQQIELQYVKTLGSICSGPPSFIRGYNMERWQNGQAVDTTWYLPGDLAEQPIDVSSALAKAGADNSFERLAIDLKMPWMHHRTDEDLGCPHHAIGDQPGACVPGMYPSPDDTCDATRWPSKNESNDSWCVAQNRSNNRFDFVHSNPDKNNDGNGWPYNGSHGKVSDTLATVFLGYMTDAVPGADNDGYVQPTSPFFVPGMHAADCDQDTRWVAPGAPVGTSGTLGAPNITQNTTSPEALVRGSLVFNATVDERFAAVANGTTLLDWSRTGSGGSATLLTGSTTRAYTFNTTTVPDGLVTITATSRDPYCGTHGSDTLRVQVDNTAPTAAISSGAISGNVFPLTGSWYDFVGLSSVTFWAVPPAASAHELTTCRQTNPATSSYVCNWDSAPEVATYGNGNYSFYIVATDKAGNTTQSTAIVLTTGSVLPPTSVYGLPTSATALSVYWTPPTSGPVPSWYNVSRSTSSTGPFTFLGIAATAPYNDAGLTTNTTYYYQVTATSSQSGATRTSAASVVSGPPWGRPNAAVTGFSVTNQNNQVRLSWTAHPLGAASYIVYKNGNYLAEPTTTFYVEPLTNGTTASYSVRAVIQGYRSAETTQLVGAPAKGTQRITTALVPVCSSTYNSGYDCKYGNDTDATVSHWAAAAATAPNATWTVDLGAAYAAAGKSTNVVDLQVKCDQAGTGYVKTSTDGVTFSAGTAFSCGTTSTLLGVSVNALQGRFVRVQAPSTLPTTGVYMRVYNVQAFTN
ncbi:MAG: hypothetical protein IT381_23600 [Deltaproteobacteria bacterium]|nr:hypothetical protein [Deltaproteobacteria bacterium]